jgi:dienelactone hydrolase
LFPDLKSVKTTGQYSYKSCVLELSDNSRLEEFKNDGNFRILSALAYYPDSDGIEKNSCPLIVFSHGGISTSTSNISLYEELASHGYVVVSISHTYHALQTKINGKNISIDSGYMKELNKENSHQDIEKSYEYFQKWMKIRTKDISFVIDTFIQKSVDESNSFYSLIDATSIGVAGHSLGGSAALGVARQRDDIKAVIALESPYMFDITGVSGNEFSWNTSPYPCAIMNVYSDTGYPLIEKDNKYVQNKNLYNSENVENHYIEGSNHYSLTDLNRMSPILCVLLGGGYKKSGYDTLEFINKKSLDFFDKYLK